MDLGYVFHKAYHLTSFLKHLSPRAAGALLQRVNYVTIIYFFYVIKAVKIVLEQFKLAKLSYNIQEQLIPCRY